jgi:hypothetical protein
VKFSRIGPFAGFSRGKFIGLSAFLPVFAVGTGIAKENFRNPFDSHDDSTRFAACPPDKKNNNTNNYSYETTKKSVYTD